MRYRNSALKWFSRVSAIILAVVVLAVDYGDIIPMNEHARQLLVTQYPNFVPMDQNDEIYRSAKLIFFIYTGLILASIICIFVGFGRRRIIGIIGWIVLALVALLSIFR